MTTIVAMALIVVVLAALVWPLFVETRAAARPARGRTLMDLEEAYRSALADLQDAQADWEAGSISDGDYATLRESYRTRAAEALRALSVGEEQLGPSLPEAAPVATPSPQPSPARGEGASQGRRQSLPMAGAASRAEPVKAIVARSVPPAAIIAGALAVLGVGAVTGLYLWQAGRQAAQTPQAVLQLDHAHAVFIDSTGELWIGHHDGLIRSQDGRVWSGTGIDADVMAIVPTSPDRRLLLGHDVLLALSADGRSTRLSHDLPGTDVHGADAGFGGVVAYVVGFGVFRSTSGERWELLAPPVPQSVGGLAVIPSPGGDTLFLAVGGTVARSADGGRTWSAAAGAASLALMGSIRGIAADGGTGTLYAASSDGLYRSRSLGADWTKLPYRGSVGAVGARGQRVVVVDDGGRVFISNDGGATWPGP